MSFSNVFQGAVPLLWKGFQITVAISVLGIIAGLAVGFLLCIAGKSKLRILRLISGIYVWVIRGTPMIVQAFLIFFAFPQLIRMAYPNFTITPFVGGLLTLSLNAGAYISEILRGGVDAVPKGQTEAARSLGLSKIKTTVGIVFPQAIRICAPSLVNQFIITIKDSSILSVIGLGEIVNSAKVYVGKTYDFFPTYIVVAACYLILISMLMVVSKIMEKKLQYGK